MSFEIPFSHIAEIIMGQSPKGEEVNNEGIGLPLLNGPTEFTDRYPAPVQHTAYAKKISLPGDILFCVRGSTTGRMNYSDQKYCIGRGLAAIRGRNGYPTPYVKAVLETYLPKLLTAATGSTFPNVSKDLINNIPVSVLPVENACNISKLIELQEEKVFTNNQINQTLEQMAQALFKSWFVDFEPVKVKIAVLEAGGSQEEATFAAMTAISGKDADSLAVFEQEHPEKYAELRAIAELFPSAMQDSELGEIPIGWFCTDLSYLALLNNSSWSKKNAPESLKYVDLANTKWGIIHSTEEFFFSDAPSRARRILKPGDTIVGTVRPGNGSYAFIAEDGLTGSTGFAVLTPKHEHFSSFIYICATSKDNIERLAHLADGGAYPAVNADVVLSTPCIVPVDHNSSKNLIECFHHYVRELFAYKHSNLRQNKSLEQLRDTLLPKLLSGEITLPEAEELAKEADYV
ncbi:restriction endonuclease subunit S [Salmonella enterica]|nr:restriction endonuclease subunit S [Salmonella enterica]ELC6769553.1 restriction endonuclease subunit S [Salmonella enterica]ELC6796214.1 restriction endonuclease subunit S [Salmonella enterica]EMA5798933.1 restriction endonuclease subunit S [Salmonella enterica]EMA5890697.1 restriction endonuclease subunit S [Salmonella enterica]